VFSKLKNGIFYKLLSSQGGFWNSKAFTQNFKLQDHERASIHYKGRVGDLKQG